MRQPASLLASAVAMALLAGTAYADIGDNPELNLPRRVETAVGYVQGTNTPVTYVVANGMALLGDIALGTHIEIQKNGIPPLFVADWTKKSDNQSRFAPKDNHYKTATRWPNNTLYYMIDPTLTKAKRDVIMAGMKLITDKTAIRFKERTSEPNYVKFISSGGCWSYAGMKGGEQPISIGDGCERAGVVAHELIHALGWMHEHMRPDRDNYIIVHEENISDSMKGQFTKLRPDQVDPVGAYDLDSVMHYPTWAMSKNMKPTIEPKDPKVDPKRLGQRADLSPGDAASLRSFYPGDIGTGDLKVALSTKELQIDQNVKGQVTLDLSGNDADVKSVKFTVTSDNEAVVAASGVNIAAAQGNQRTVTIAPVANASGTANLTIRATAASGKEAIATLKVVVQRDPAGGNGNVKLALSITDLQLKQNASGQLTIDLAGSEGDVKAIKVEVKSDNESMVANAGLVVGNLAGTQRPLTVTPVANASGVATLTVRAVSATGKEATARVKVTVAKDSHGGNEKPFDPKAMYKTGDRVSYQGKAYEMTVLFKGEVVNNYTVYGNMCIPGACAKDKPGTWGQMSYYWTAAGDSGGPKPGCDVVIDTKREYRIATPGQKKSLVPAGDVQGSPLIVWPDEGAQRWQLQRNAEGYYAIVSTGSKLAIDAAGSTAGSEVVLSPAGTAQSQQFCPKQTGNNYQLIARHSNLAAGSASEADGAKVVQQAPANANWTLNPL